ncbi:metal-dependent amidase/aminoacylase/carboxypeptidase [Cupriavidus necator N-1]|jgi:hippurate hydrolase|uniref:Metal-dependent amidase/aminoacylase/carboxypeptidase n=1 Tax=Cupriavidus necator (strain ATCC 43291 / DSM 13513 / CCUG 52238 / LMG 8453 / N-1) TaxID=1042878 RepID=F8GNY1_CUPNN|nr:MULTISPECIES: M20 aminoacylase family protein [Cupriavidus]AEI80430.1 metal-dependent amidase/aminoacylase/carboxypeptidase [Cupriavidus necator N-1]KAI3595397.1 Amidohydrolase family protein [Cupriavidus necator H850]MDX6009943.1 M20 aminoacylase family protein [Cupriavidus necator]QUN30650.1 amidohydrolase [Cupriavidus sp. KK10]
MNQAPLADLHQSIQTLSPEFVEIRRKIHAHPELAFEERRTSDLVAGRLAAWGYEVHRGMGTTGVVGRLRKGQGSKALGIRADMDALPIQEKTGLDYASTIAGKMHACGHDGHTAILLCAARYLAESADFNGTLNLIFQPAEENEGGALRMLEDGLFEQFPCDEIYALHNSPGLPVGQIGVIAGPAMASFDRATVTLRGRGAHGAMPHHGIDAMQCAASIVLGLQSIVSREIDALKSAVITVGSIQAGTTYNVVPDSATIKIGVRTLDPQVRTLVEARISEFVAAQAQSFRLQSEVVYERKYPVLVNHDAQTERARQAAIRLVGADNVVERPPVMGSEDFAYMLEHRPGAYIRLGNGLGEDGGCMVHNPLYDFNDKALPVGAAFWAHLTQSYLV